MKVAFHALLVAVVVCRGLSAAYAQPTPKPPRAPSETPPADEVKSVASPYEDTLRAANLKPTAESLGKWLSDMHADGEMTKRVAALVKQLGDNDFFKREAATTELITMGVQNDAQIIAATKSDDLEIRWRAKQVLKQASSGSAKLVYAVLSVIHNKPIKGLVKPVAEAIPLCGQDYVKQAARRALLATVSEADVPLLQSIVQGKQPHVGDEVFTRTAAIECLESLKTADTQKILNPLLQDESDEIQFAACRALINLKERRVLPQLVALLKSDELKVRRMSSRVLREATGQRFNYSPYAKEEDRKASIEQWRKWIASQGATAQLHLPLAATRPVLGRTIMTNYTRKEAVEIDANGKETWRATMSGIWGCEGLPNGHRLLASYTGKELREYDDSGKMIWQLSLDDKPYFITRLNNGNTLTTVYNKKVMEIRPDKTIAWQMTLPERCKFAIRLDNGNTLYALYDTARIVEMTAEGKILREIKTGHARPYAMQLLPNGHMLIAYRTNNLAVECDASGKVVWTYKCSGSLYQAQRLQNGNTLLCGQFGALEVKPDGTTAWKLPGSLRGIHRY